MSDNNTNNPLISILEKKQNRKIRLVLKNGFSYLTENLKVVNNDSVIFTDKLSNEMMVCISEIVQVMEVGNGK
ncbi:hypothetical protein LCGC14_2657540 [marine sediment metagenome]|uniref:Uncharacterized protein n=1 Tax=marine sediment metagenome TaxID=412755 RepID=A0A0F8ZSX2_9ZZZZ